MRPAYVGAGPVRTAEHPGHPALHHVRLCGHGHAAGPVREPLTVRACLCSVNCPLLQPDYRAHSTGGLPGLSKDQAHRHFRPHADTRPQRMAGLGAVGDADISVAVVVAGHTVQPK